MKKALLVWAVGAVLLLGFTNKLSAEPAPQVVIGILEESKVAPIRATQNVAISEAISKLAVEMKLTAVVSSVAWSAPSIKIIDITDEVFARLKIMGVTLPLPIEKQPQAPLTKEQKDAATQAIKVLRRLKSVTEAGLSYNAYSERIIEAKADIDEQIDLLAEGDLKKEISSSLEAFADARTVWDESIRLTMLRSLKYGRSGVILSKYSIKYDFDARGEYGKVDGGDRSLWLNQVWQKADEHFVQAEKVLE